MKILLDIPHFYILILKLTSYKFPEIWNIYLFIFGKTIKYVSARRGSLLKYFFHKVPKTNSHVAK